jgi:hypothetical protein
MITKIRLATPAHLAGLTAAWFAVLMTIDYTKNPHLWAKDAREERRGAPLSLWVNHLCCTGCLADARKALESLPWIKGHPIAVRARLRSREQAEAAGPAEAFGGWIDVGLPDVTGVDFVQLDRALRGAGLVASRMEFGGAAHFRLEAEVKHLCCGMCKGAAERMSELGRMRALGRLRWLDSVSADHAKHRIVVHARYLQAGESVDVAELLGALDEVGLPPTSLRVLTGPERADSGGRLRLADAGGGL